MNGRDLALGVVTGLAVAGVVSKRRGSRAAPVRFPDRYDELVSVATEAYDSLNDGYEEDEDEDWDTRVSQLVQLLAANGFRVIGRGGSRVVVKLDDTYAAKVAAKPKGIRQNEYESGTWGVVTREAPKQAALLMPVHDVDGEGVVLLTEIATPCTEKNEAACAAVLRQARQTLGSSPLTRDLVDATFEFNWGFHHGVFKLLDYGQ